MKEVVQPQSLSDPRPRYSQGIVTQPGKLLFIAGQTASDKNGNVVGKGDIEAQAKPVFENLQAVLKETGASLDNMVMTTTYITDIKYREGYGRVRNQFYKGTPPTSTLVVVKGWQIQTIRSRLPASRHSSLECSRHPELESFVRLN